MSGTEADEVIDYGCDVDEEQYMTSRPYIKTIRGYLVPPAWVLEAIATPTAPGGED